MPKINVLSKEVASLIAAGEVVEKPASVIKELIENSVDAGSKRITVEIKNGGVTYMRVTDDGCGISNEDIRNAFLPHATSKISSAEDLDKIFTLGFRGEALASICSVSRVGVITKTSGQETGISYVIEGGVETDLTESGCPEGTTVIVRDLFYNTPARAKFLKKDQTEGNYIVDVVSTQALSHPEISFILIRDGKTVLNTTGSGDLFTVISQVLSKEFAQTLVSASYVQGSYSVKGYLSKPSFGRKNRAMQYFFVNGRYVRIPSACAALDEAYRHAEMTGKYPSCVLFIDLPLDLVDVNVHPSKTEVRFSDDRSVFGLIYNCARLSLLNTDHSPIDELSLTRQNVSPAPDEPISYDQAKIVSEDPIDSKPIVAPSLIDRSNERPPLPRIIEADAFLREEKRTVLRDESYLDIDAADDKPDTKDDPVELPDKKIITPDFVYIGEVFKTYLIAESDGKLLFIDKHAAHERIIFNRLMKRKSAQDIQTVIPVNFKPSSREYEILLQNKELLLKAGFEIDDFGNGSLIITGVPGFLGNEDPVDALCEIAGKLLGGGSVSNTNKTERIFETIACRAAVKAGSDMTLSEAVDFIGDVLSDPEVTTCPHGRPVVIEISKKDFDKRFGRLG